MSNELTTQAYNNLVAYNPKTSLVEVRLNPDKYPRIGKTNESQAFVLMKEIVVSAYMYRGQQADEEMVNFTTANLLAELTDPNNEYGTQHLSWFESHKEGCTWIEQRDVRHLRIITLCCHY